MSNGGRVDDEYCANSLAKASRERWEVTMTSFRAVIERHADTGLYVGWVPGFAGAHSQGETLDELQANLKEVISMLLEDPSRAPI